MDEKPSDNIVQYEPTRSEEGWTKDTHWPWPEEASSYLGTMANHPWESKLLGAVDEQGSRSHI